VNERVRVTVGERKGTNGSPHVEHYEATANVYLRGEEVIAIELTNLEGMSKGKGKGKG